MINVSLFSIDAEYDSCKWLQRLRYCVIFSIQILRFERKLIFFSKEN